MGPDDEVLVSAEGAPFEGSVVIEVGAVVGTGVGVGSVGEVGVEIVGDPSSFDVVEPFEESSGGGEGLRMYLMPWISWSGCACDHFCIGCSCQEPTYESLVDNRNLITRNTCSLPGYYQIYFSVLPVEVVVQSRLGSQHVHHSNSSNPVDHHLELVDLH